jgi:excinuclease ABC subunit C
MLNHKLQTLPELPGCYLMRNKNNEIIYVGKAKNLKHRVNSYFNRQNDYKTTQLVKQIVDFDFILTNSEKEALLLEINLIKKHRPRFNIMFMDDKSYPYLKISYEKFPTLQVVREIRKDRKATYYGPYPNSTAAHLTCKIINEMFPLKKCNVMPKKVCLYYHLGQCLGMCEYPVDKKVYEELLGQVSSLLKHSQKSLLELLNVRMNLASESMQYEKAKQYRDYIQALSYVGALQHVDLAENIKVDIINYEIDQGLIAIQVLMIRSGKLLDKSSFVYPFYDLQDAMETFIMQFYDQNLVPSEVILPSEIDTDTISSHLSIRFTTYQKGKFSKLLAIAKQNAAQVLKQKQAMNAKDQGFKQSAINELNDIFHQPINRIEIFDNSHIGGTHNVSAMVVVEDNDFKRRDYRLFNLKEYSSDIDSFKEVLYRHYYKALINGIQQPCDLLIVDGGIQQINAARAILESLNFKQVILCGLVKDHSHRTSALMDEMGAVIKLSHDSAAFRFLTLMQDEVHRFVLGHHQRKRSKAMIDSQLDHVPGIGKHRKELLLKHFKSYASIKRQDLADLQSVIGKKSGQQLFDFFHKID